MRIRIYLLLCIALLTGDCIHGSARSKDGILVISSYSPLKENGNHVIASLVGALREETDRNLFVEYMDCENSPELAEWKSWMNSMFRAHDETPEAVVILGGEAWTTYRECVPDTWRDVPVVLGLVKRGYIDYVAREKEKITDIRQISPIDSTFDGFRVTGYYYADYFNENIDFIKRLQPEVTRIAFCYDDRYAHDFFEPYLSQLVASHPPLELDYLVGSRLSTQELLKSIFAMDSSYALLTGGWYTDRNRYPHAYSMLHNELTRHSTKNMYQLQEQDLTEANYIGGYFVSGKELGRDIAGLTYSVLTEGIENSPAFGPTPSSPRHHVNYKTLLKMGIDPSRLPADTVLHNTDPTLLERYPVEVALVCCLLLLLTASAIFALVYRRKREQQYKKNSQKMQHLLGSMPNMVVIFDREMNIVDILNPDRVIMLGKTVDELKGNNLYRLQENFPTFSEAAETLISHVTSTEKTKQARDFSYEVTTTRNETLYIEARSVPFEDRKVLLFVHDTTTRVAAEKKAVMLKDFLQSIIHSLPVGVFVKDANDQFRYLFYNKKANDFYLEGKELLLGKNDYELDSPVARQYREEDEKALESETPLVFDRVMYDNETKSYRFGVATKSRLIRDDGSRYIITTIADMTDLHKKETELNNIRNELSIALDAGSLSAWIYDVEEAKFMSLYGNTLSDGSPSSNTVQHMAHPESRADLEEFMKALLSGGEPKRRGVFRFMRNGQYEWYEAYAIAQKSPRTGRVVRIVGTERNITTEIEHQQKKEEYRLQLELAFDAAGITPWSYDVENDEFTSPSDKSVLYGHRYSLQEAVQVLMPDDRRASFLEAIGHLVDGTTQAIDAVFLFKQASGQHEWSQITAKAFKRDSNGRARKIVGTRKYITESFEAEKKLKAYNFKSDLAIKSSGIVQWDYDVQTGIISSPNQNAFLRDGLPIGTYLKLIHPEDANRFKEALQGMIERGDETIHHQIRINIQQEGGYRWADIHGVAFERDPNGRITKITGLRRDITDLKNMTHELIVLRDRAEEANRLKTAFLANMSHEIRTPLNAIVGFSNLIAQTRNPEEIAEFCKIIETNNELLLQLINDILDLSKIEAGQLEFVYSDIDMNELFRNLEQIYLFRLKGTVQLICNLPERTFVTHSERNRLTQVVSNFLSNACKFTTEGSITMGYECSDGLIRCFVTDTGKGIAPENLPHVFERFAKFDAFIQGTGLGLSICKTIIDKLGGEIGVESEEGKGTTFWFTIPARPPEGGDPETIADL